MSFVVQNTVEFRVFSVSTQINASACNYFPPLVRSLELQRFRMLSRRSYKMSIEKYYAISNIVCVSPRAFAKVGSVRKGSYFQ